MTSRVWFQSAANVMLAPGRVHFAALIVDAGSMLYTPGMRRHADGCLWYLSSSPLVYLVPILCPLMFHLCAPPSAHCIRAPVLGPIPANVLHHLHLQLAHMIVRCGRTVAMPCCALTAVHAAHPGVQPHYIRSCDDAVLLRSTLPSICGFAD